MCDGCEADLAAFEPLTALIRMAKNEVGRRSRYRGGHLEHLEMHCRETLEKARTARFDKMTGQAPSKLKGTLEMRNTEFFISSLLKSHFFS